MNLKNKLHLINIGHWLHANKLHLNTDKTCYSIFSPTKSRVSYLQLTFNNTEIRHVATSNYLGVFIDEDFKWSTHFAAVQFKLQRIIGICFKLRYKLPDWCLKNIYFAFVHPYILYGLEVYVWHEVYVWQTRLSLHDFNKLTKLNNKILRALQKKPYNCCNECLYTEYNTLPPIQLFSYQILWLVHIMIYLPDSVPFIFKSYYTRNKSIHDHNTRYNKLHQSQINSKHGQHSIKFKGTLLWNQLPPKLLDISSPIIFTKEIKKFLTLNPL